MPESIRAALIFLINTLFDLYLIVLTIRVVLAYSRANYFNPITQFVVKLSDFIVKPLRRMIPNFRNLEISTIVLILILEMVKFFCISILSYGLPNVLGLFILGIADFLKLLAQTFFYAILLQTILSWVQPYSPINQILLQVTSPILRPIQRWVPPVAGFDISPIPALIGLQLIIMLFINPLMNVGSNIAF